MRWTSWMISLFLLLYSLASCGSDGEISLKPVPTPTSSGPNYVGISHLGVNHLLMDCKWLDLFSHSKKPALAFLYRSFGNNDACVISFLKRYPNALVNLYASNGSCLRKDICSEKEATTAEEIIARAKEGASLISDHCPGCHLRITIQLEDDLDNTTACYIADALRLLLPPQTEIWRNPNNPKRHRFRSNCFDGVELHNKHRFPRRYRGRCAWSNDGQDLLVGDTIWNHQPRITSGRVYELATGELAGCDIYLWTADGNCLGTDSNAAPAPPHRSCKTDPATIDGLSRLTETIENAEARQ